MFDKAFFITHKNKIITVVVSTVAIIGAILLILLISSNTVKKRVANYSAVRTQALSLIDTRMDAIHASLPELTQVHPDLASSTEVALAFRFEDIEYTYLETDALMKQLYNYLATHEAIQLTSQGRVLVHMLMTISSIEDELTEVMASYEHVATLLNQSFETHALSVKRLDVKRPELLAIAQALRTRP